MPSVDAPADPRKRQGQLKVPPEEMEDGGIGDTNMANDALPEDIDDEPFLPMDEDLDDDDADDVDADESLSDDGNMVRCTEC